MNQHSKKKWFFLGFVALFLAIVLLGGLDYLNFQSIKAQQALFQTQFAQTPYIVMGLYVFVYALLTAISFPGATVLTLLGGALFGLPLGVVLVSFSSTVGATLAFLLSRYFLASIVRSHYSEKVRAIQNGFERDGATYLLSLRLVVLFPFWLINVLMGLTRIKTWTYVWVSLVGMFPATVIYVNAGTQLANLESLGDVLSPVMIFSFVILAFFPFLTKKVVQKLKAYRLMKPYQKPKTIDFNTIVIGGGAAGLVSAYSGASLKAKVLLIEKEKMGGDCLYTGCVPSKTIIEASRLLSSVHKAKPYGIELKNTAFDYAQLIRRVKQVIADIEPHDSIERYQALGVHCLSGSAKIISPWQVKVADEIYSANRIIIATGARPSIPNIEGLTSVPFRTAETFWQMEQRPKQLLIIGGGVMACEMAQSYCCFGTEVCIVSVSERLMPSTDIEASDVLQSSLEQEGASILLNSTVEALHRKDGLTMAHIKTGGAIQSKIFDEVLVAVGRNANSENLGLDELGVIVNEKGVIEVDATQRTNMPTIYACGDVAGEIHQTHLASLTGSNSMLNSLFDDVWRFKTSTKAVPQVVYCSPEIATVGSSEQMLKAEQLDYEVTRFTFDDFDRAIISNEREGFIKVFTPKGKDKILGVVIVGARAGEMIMEFSLAIEHGLSLKKLISSVHPYPSWSDANKLTAGLWMRQHQPTGVLNVIKRYHNARRQ